MAMDPGLCAYTYTVLYVLQSIIKFPRCFLEYYLLKKYTAEMVPRNAHITELTHTRSIYLRMYVHITSSVTSHLL